MIIFTLLFIKETPLPINTSIYSGVKKKKIF